MAGPEHPTPQGPDAEVRHVTILNAIWSARPVPRSGSTSRDNGIPERIPADRDRRRRALWSAYRKVRRRGAMVVFGFPRTERKMRQVGGAHGHGTRRRGTIGRIVPNVRLQIRVWRRVGPDRDRQAAIAVRERPDRGMTIGDGRAAESARRSRPGRASPTPRSASPEAFPVRGPRVVKSKGFDGACGHGGSCGASPVASRFEAQRFDPSRAKSSAAPTCWPASRTRGRPRCGGAGQAVCLVGDAGIGKSRLALAALDAATRDGAAHAQDRLHAEHRQYADVPDRRAVPTNREHHAASSEAEKRALAQQLLARLLPARRGARGIDLSRTAVRAGERALAGGRRSCRGARRR